MNKQKQEIRTAGGSGFLSFWLLLILVLCFSFLSIYKTHSKNYSVFNRTWGFDHIIYYGTSARIFFYLACLVIILPYSNKILQTGLSWLSHKLLPLRKKKILLFLFISGVSVFLFYVLRVKYYFLGDFNMRMNQTMKKEFVSTEYLTMKMLYYFTRFGSKYGYSTDQLFKLYSYLAGGFFVFTSCLIADITGKNPLQKTLFFLAQVCSSLLLVFCGYVEIYATPIVFLTLYFYSGLRYLKYNKGFLYAAIILCIAIASHFLCIAAVPSLFVAWYFNNKSKIPSIVSLSNKKIAVIISGLVIISLIIAFKAKSAFLLTISAPPAQPKLLTLFSFRHFWELFNGQILCCGLSILLIFVLLLKSIRGKKQLFSEHYFLLSISACFLLLICIANLQRGSGDWDIMSFPAVTLNLLTVMLIMHLYKNDTGLANYLAIALIAFNGLNAFLWLQVNHTDKSIRKIENMLVTDPGTYYTARITGMVQIALLYSNNKLYDETERACLMACNASAQNDVKPCVMYALGLKTSKKYEEARDLFEDMLQNRTPYIYEAYVYLIEYYEQKDNNEKFTYYLNKLFDSFIQNPDSFTTNVNFKPQVLINMFDILYRFIVPESDTKRRELIKNVMESLKQLKPQTQK